MKILGKKKIRLICERQIANCIIAANAFLKEELSAEEYDYTLSNSMATIRDIGGQKWLSYAMDEFKKRVRKDLKEDENV